MTLIATGMLCPAKQETVIPEGTHFAPKGTCLGGVIPIAGNSGSYDATQGISMAAL